MILLPAIYEGSRDLKDRSKKLVFQTNEITPEQASALQLCVQAFVYLAIKLEAFTKEEENIVANLKTDYDDFQKSQSQRLRGVFFKLYEQAPEGYGDFNSYYNHKMEELIKHFKTKIK